MQKTTPASTHSTVNQGGTVQEYLWQWDNQSIRVVYETLGEGNPVLLLPAFSTVSTRQEMGGLARQLSVRFRVLTLDWVGFGASSRLPLDYRPVLYRQFLTEFVRDTFTEPVAVVAAGHASGYVMHLAAQTSSPWSRIVLVAPTWRGPLPTMGASPQLAAMVRGSVRSPLLGQALYKLNTVPAFLRFMYRQHVYTDANRLTAAFINRKYQLTQQPGARFAPAAFVTGALDPVQKRAEFLTWFQSLSTLVMVVIGEQAPPQSKAEMEAIAALPGVQTHRLPGSLGLHEEFPTELAAVVIPFLRQES